MMSKHKIIRIPLQEYSRFHFGELKMDDNLALSTTSSFAHSDTLFSALVHAYARFHGDAKDFTDYFKYGQLAISSLFYYLRNNGAYVYFLPKPSFLSIKNEKTVDGSHKMFNRIAFVSIGVWNKGFEMNKWFEEDSKEYAIIDKKLVVTAEEMIDLGLEARGIRKDELKVYQTTMSPKSPQRSTTKAAIYYQADTQIAGSVCVDQENTDFEIGWYFFYQAEQQAEKGLKTATNIMAYTGIGGEKHNTGRSVKSSPEFDNTISFDKENNRFCSLSLINPAESQEFSKIEYYRTILRGGRMLPGGQAKVVRMITEGALTSSSDLKGRLVPLGFDENGKTIYRNGIPFLIPVNYDD